MTHQRAFFDPVPQVPRTKKLAFIAVVRQSSRRADHDPTSPSSSGQVLSLHPPRVPLEMARAVHCKGVELDDDPNSAPEKAILQILDYFLRHPEAVDSADGIAHWRLLGEVSQLSLAETEEGLGWLVSRGYLREVAVPGSRHVYALNPEMQDEATQFLRDARRMPEQS
jgi:hypothetical protein